MGSKDRVNSRYQKKLLRALWFLVVLMVSLLGLAYVFLPKIDVDFDEDISRNKQTQAVHDKESLDLATEILQLKAQNEALKAEMKRIKEEKPVATFSGNEQVALRGEKESPQMIQQPQPQSQSRSSVETPKEARSAAKDMPKEERAKTFKIPGSETPKTFNIHTWYAAAAARQALQPASTSQQWRELPDKDPPTFRAAVQQLAAEPLLAEAVMVILMNPECSRLVPPWRKWLIENLGLNGSPSSILSALMRNADDSTLEHTMLTLKSCSGRKSVIGEQALFSEAAVGKVQNEHNQWMSELFRDIQTSEGDADRWRRRRAGFNGSWRPQSRNQMSLADTFPGAKKLSDVPVVYHITGLLTDEECDELIAKAEPRLEPSRTVSAGPEHRLSSDRTSMGAWLYRHENHTAVKTLESKVAALTGMDEDVIEGTHVLRYQPTQSYRPHMDNCDSTAPDGPIPPECEQFLGRSGDRVGSVITMLHEPERGGATAFPNVHKVGDEYQLDRNHQGLCTDDDVLKVHMKKGDAVLFWSYLPEDTHPRGEVDWGAMHTGCKVEGGQKWISTNWLRGSRYRN